MDWIIFLTVFGILFLGELGDKTQLIVFNLTLEQEKSYKVGIGATLGFAVIVTIGVLFGSIITNYVPISLISIISGIIFILLGIIDIFSGFVCANFVFDILQSVYTAAAKEAMEILFNFIDHLNDRFSNWYRARVVYKRFDYPEGG